jgi:hypothetical protein
VAQGVSKIAIEVASSDVSSLQEQIGCLAYRLWQQRGSPEGSSKEDWLRAERELTGVLQMWSRESHEDVFAVDKELH